MEQAQESDSGLDRNRRKAFVGTVAEHEKTKGWSFGSFVEEPLLSSNLVEVAWQKLPGLVPSTDQEHFHRVTVEINIVINGWIGLQIDENMHRLEAGQFNVIWPESVVSNLTTGDDMEMIVVRAPSIPTDKFLGVPQP